MAARLAVVAERVDALATRVMASAGFTGLSLTWTMVEESIGARAMEVTPRPKHLTTAILIGLAGVGLLVFVSFLR